MNEFSKLFTSEYIKDFTGSVSLPNKKEFEDMVGFNQLGDGLARFGTTLRGFFVPLPSFEELISKIRNA